MPVLSASDIPDLVNAVYNRMLSKRTWNDVSLDLPFFTITDRFFKGRKQNISGTPMVVWKLQVDNPQNARFVGIHSTDQYDLRSLSTGGSAPWAHCTTNYNWDLTEPSFATDNEMVLFDQILMREHGMMNDWFKFLEQKFWGAPASSSISPQELYGIPFWVQKNATPGFYGGNPSGFTSGAGNINSTMYRGWRNRTGTYSTVTRNGLIATWKTNIRQCDFVSPHAYPAQNPGDQHRYAFYTDEYVHEEASKYLDARAQAITDLSGTGRVMFAGIPVEWVPALSDPNSVNYDSQHPVYGIDWNTMALYFQQSWEMMRTPAQRLPNMHLEFAVHMDSILQLVCTNRRPNFVIYRA